MRKDSAVNIRNLSLSDNQVALLSQKMGEARHSAIYAYPWNSLEGDLAQAGEAALTIVAYGSLVNADSAARTLRDTSSRLGDPVIAFGVRRVFDYPMRSESTAYGPAPDAIARAALNVHLTGRIEDAVNGTLAEVSLEDLPHFRIREYGYDLAPVACLKWNDINQPPFMTYILSFPEERRTGEINKRLQPHPGYYRVCREGARRLGQDFLNFWLTTTYLGDAVTPVAQWEREKFR